jgi:hypothetical protein
MGGIAGFAGAPALVSRRYAESQAAANPAKAVALVPVVDPPRIGQQVALLVLNIGPDLAQILKQARRAQHVMG